MTVGELLDIYEFADPSLEYAGDLRFLRSFDPSTPIVEVFAGIDWKRENLIWATNARFQVVFHPTIWRSFYDYYSPLYHNYVQNWTAMTRDQKDYELKIFAVKWAESASQHWQKQLDHWEELFDNATHD